MSQEISISATMQVAKTFASKSLSASFKPTLTGANFSQASQSVPTTAGGTAINLAGLGSVGWYLIKNNDPTNNLDLLSAVSGTAIATMQPGECIMGRFPSSITAPALLAHTAAIACEYLICEN